MSAAGWGGFKECWQQKGSLITDWHYTRHSLNIVTVNVRAWSSEQLLVFCLSLVANADWLVAGHYVVIWLRLARVSCLRLRNVDHAWRKDSLWCPAPTTCNSWRCVAVGQNPVKPDVPTIITAVSSSEMGTLSRSRKQCRPSLYWIRESVEQSRGGQLKIAESPL